MKKKHSLTEGRTILLCIAVLLLTALCVIAIHAIDHARYTSPEYYARYVAEHESELTFLAEKALLKNELSPSSHGWSSITLEGRHKFIDLLAYEGCAIFVIDYDYAPEEGHIGLIYQPDGEHTPVVRYPENWHPVETSDENTLRWEGGMSGRGWIDATRLSDHFFLEIAFIPT